jgi:NADPH:quinone reductase-like Zn-dependent oxidoreductase
MNRHARVIRFHRTGVPEVLQIDEIELPSLKNNEVLLKMDSLAISRADILWREGDYVEDPILPAQIGYEAAGIVDSIGSNVKTLRPGDRVSTFPAASLIDYAAHGEQIVYPESSLLTYPPNLNPGQAASANTALFLAYFALVELAGLQRGRYVVITAATASTGIAALQLAKRLGAKCIAITRSSSRRVELTSAGADHVIVAGEEDIRDAILDLTDGLGADLIYDAVGGPGLEELVWATRRLGRIVVYGALGNGTAETRIPLGACFVRGVRVCAAVKIFDFTGNRRLGIAPDRAAVERAKTFVAEGLAAEIFTPKIDRVFVGLEQYRLAQSYMETPDRKGKVVISLP